MEIRNDGDILIEAENYSLAYDDARPGFIELRVSNGIGARLFAASGCDLDDGIDRLS